MKIILEYETEEDLQRLLSMAQAIKDIEPKTEVGWRKAGIYARKDKAGGTEDRPIIIYKTGKGSICMKIVPQPKCDE